MWNLTRSNKLWAEAGGLYCFIFCKWLSHIIAYTLIFGFHTKCIVYYLDVMCDLHSSY